MGGRQSERERRHRPEPGGAERQTRRKPLRREGRGRHGGVLGGLPSSRLRPLGESCYWYHFTVRTLSSEIKKLY